MDAVEELARAICRDRGIDPDAKVIMGEPLRVGCSRVAYVFCEDQITPAWNLFWFDAYEAIRVLRRQQEPKRDAA